MKKIITLSVLLITILSINAQNIGTKQTLKPYKSYLKSPDFLELLEKSKQPVKKDSTEIFIFNGFSEGKYLKWGFLQCSFEVYKFKKSIYEDEYGQWDYLEPVSSTYYIYKNQKIIYKEIQFKKNDKEEVLTVGYYQNGKPKYLESSLEETDWYFDKKGNIAKLSYDEFGNTVVLFDLEEEKKFILDNSRFTLEEHLKIREDLSKMIHNTDIPGKSYDDYTVSDWKILNKTKKYLKKLFNTDVDLYLDGLSIYETIFYSEYGDFYSLMPDWKEFEEQKEKYNKKPQNIEQN